MRVCNLLTYLFSQEMDRCSKKEKISVLTRKKKKTRQPPIMDMIMMLFDDIRVDSETILFLNSMNIYLLIFHHLMIVIGVMFSSIW